MVVVAAPEPPEKIGKFRYRDVILEVSYLPSEVLSSPEAVLSQYHLAGSFRSASVILDPTGHLTGLQRAVAKDFVKREWVVRRCDDAHERVLRNLQSLDAAEAFHDQVTAWLFATGVTTHILLVAGLKNPTVRRRYEATRTLLSDYGLGEFYEKLLSLLGADRLTKGCVQDHVSSLEEAFDAASAIITSPFPFAGDISKVGRPIVIDGSREMIAAGHHQEAVFWVVATYARCMSVFATDAPREVYRRYEVGFRSLLADLGIASSVDLLRRGAQVKAFLPEVEAVAQAMIAANPEIGESELERMSRPAT
jgi:hypothetical protein